MLTPAMLSTDPANTMPATRAGAESSRRSSTRPTEKISTAARATPAGAELSNTAEKVSSRQATTMATRKATIMATPPIVAVGTEWIRRSSGATTAPRGLGEPADHRGQDEGDGERHRHDPQLGLHAVTLLVRRAGARARWSAGTVRVRHRPGRGQPSALTIQVAAGSRMTPSWSCAPSASAAAATAARRHRPSRPRAPAQPRDSAPAIACGDRVRSSVRPSVASVGPGSTVMPSNPDASSSDAIMVGVGQGERSGLAAPGRCRQLEVLGRSEHGHDDERVGRRTLEADEADAAPFDQRRPHVGERGDRVGEEHDPEAGERHVELLGSERARLDVRLHELDVRRSDGLGPPSGRGEHRRRQVDAGHRGRVAPATRAAPSWHRRRSRRPEPASRREARARPSHTRRTARASRRRHRRARPTPRRRPRSRSGFRRRPCRTLRPCARPTCCPGPGGAVATRTDEGSASPTGTMSG